MRRLSPIVLLLAIPASSPADDLDSLQGTWRAEAGPTGEVIVTLSVDGDRFTRVVETSPRSTFTFRGRLRVDPMTEPKQLDWLEVTGPDDAPEPDAMAIYTLDGDDLTVCSAAPGSARPDGFEPGRGRFPDLQTFRRVVETDDDEPLTGDLLALQGDWSGEVGPGGAIQASLSIKGRVIRFVLVGPEGQEILASTGRVQLDESASPKTMDWVPDGDGNQPLLSIYELDGPSLRVALGLGRGPSTRPEAFGDDFRTFTLTKADDEEKDEIPD